MKDNIYLYLRILQRQTDLTVPYLGFLNRESHWNEGLEDRPHRPAPPPAGHEDWPGALRAGLFPSSAVRRSLHRAHQQQVNTLSD